MGWKLQTLAGNCAMLMESEPWTIYWFSQGQNKKHLNRMREIQFRETSAGTEQIKYNTNGTKTSSSTNIDLLKVKKRHSWVQWSNKIQQLFCWSPLNHCYKGAKRKITPSKHEKQNQTLKKLYSVVVCSKFLVTTLHMNHGGFQCQI